MLRAQRALVQTVQHTVPRIEWPRTFNERFAAVSQGESGSSTGLRSHDGGFITKCAAPDKLSNSCISTSRCFAAAVGVLIRASSSRADHSGDGTGVQASAWTIIVVET